MHFTCMAYSDGELGTSHVQLINGGSISHMPQTAF